MYFTFSLSISFSFALFFEILYSMCFTLIFYLLLSFAHKSKVDFYVLHIHFNGGLLCYLSFLWMGCITIFVWKLKNCVVAMQVESTMFIHLLFLFCWDGPPTRSFYCWVYHHGHWTIATFFLQRSTLIS
jgi:hypothetical protein